MLLNHCVVWESSFLTYRVLLDVLLWGFLPAFPVKLPAPLGSVLSTEEILIPLESKTCSEKRGECLQCWRVFFSVLLMRAVS